MTKEIIIMTMKYLSKQKYDHEICEYKIMTMKYDNTL